MKLQAPTSKLQRNSKHQTSGALGSLKYPEVSSDSIFLNDAPPGDGVSRHAFDLEERTARFGEAIIRFCKKVPHAPENNRLINQLVGCGTSVGADYCEANEGVSKKDFKTPSAVVLKRQKKRNFSYA
jgi:hypothetical protein